MVAIEILIKCAPLVKVIFINRDKRIFTTCLQRIPI